MRFRAVGALVSLDSSSRAQSRGDAEVIAGVLDAQLGREEQDRGCEDEHARTHPSPTGRVGFPPRIEGSSHLWGRNAAGGSMIDSGGRAWRTAWRGPAPTARSPS